MSCAGQVNVRISMTNRPQGPYADNAMFPNVTAVAFGHTGTSRVTDWMNESATCN